MDRIAVIGRSGGGKSTLARRLGERLGLEVVHSDQLRWHPGWVESDRADFRVRAQAALAGDRWVWDGNASRIADLTLGRADVIAWVDLPRTACLWRVIGRVVRTYGRVRVDMAPGCPERFDAAFLAYV